MKIALVLGFVLAASVMAGEQLTTTTLAGTAGVSGYYDAPAGPGSLAQFNGAAGIVVDSSGNAYENRTSLVCGAGSDPQRKMQSAPVDRFVEVVGDREENHRCHDAQRRYEPKGRA